jgi:benzoyl-CoA reductase subunit C
MSKASKEDLMGSIEAIVERCREIEEDLSLQVVREWKERNPGGKAMGVFPVYSPVEIIHAAGMLPVGVIGGGNKIEIAYADSRFQSFVCSVVKSTMEMGLTARLQELDGVFFHSICDAARNLASVFQRNFPEMHVEYIHFPQNMESTSVDDYLVAEYQRVRKGLEERVGRPITDEDLNRSIHLYNQVRALTRSLYQIRRKSPHLISAAESFSLIRAGTFLSPEAQIQLLEEALKAVEERDAKPKDRIKVILEGAFCEQPPVDLIDNLEGAGCYLLDDDFILGWRWFQKDVPTNGDPLRALAHCYRECSVYSAVKHDTRETKASHLIQKVRNTKADAVIYLAAKFCEPALFDYPLFRKALDEEGIPHISLEFEEKAWIFDRIRMEVETFVDSMLFD